MNEIEFLQWVRGPALTAATVILVAGIVVRIIMILLMGRKANLAEARGSEMAGGIRTMFTRSFPRSGTFKRSGFTITAGYVFHIGLFITIFLFVPHILAFEKAFGISWPGLPSNLVDATAVVTMLALVAVLVHRIMDPVKRMLSGFGDYLVWFVTILPLLTGWIAFHRMGLSGTMLVALHILSVELLMVLFPFTKLMHTFTLFMSRWYNGAIAGYRGVKS